MTTLKIVDDKFYRENGQEIASDDKLIMLSNRTLLIAKVVWNDDEGMEDWLCLYKPYEIYTSTENGNSYVRDWMPESEDEFFILPYGKVVTISNPHTDFLNVYKGMLNKNKQVEKEAESMDLEESYTNAKFH